MTKAVNVKWHQLLDLFTRDLKWKAYLYPIIPLHWSKLSIHGKAYAPTYSHFENFLSTNPYLFFIIICKINFFGGWAIVCEQSKLTNVRRVCQLCCYHWSKRHLIFPYLKRVVHFKQRNLSLIFVLTPFWITFFHDLLYLCGCILFFDYYLLRNMSNQFLTR
jgi:hypothetical protein